jgi:adenosylcobinamide kinase/adenosylcobinamide-phosphate guanylyltransferase
LSKIVVVTGPARSGKSEWAETLAIQSQQAVIYIATAIATPTQGSEDTEWEERIQKHQQRRPQNWETLEVPSELSGAIASAKPNSCLLVDSLGTWVANLLVQDDQTWEKTVSEFIETVELVACDLIFVAEETGWGIIPAYSSGRIFRDRLGNLVRRLGVIAHDVYLVTGGYVLNLSILGTPLPVKW